MAGSTVGLAANWADEAGAAAGPFAPGEAAGEVGSAPPSAAAASALPIKEEKDQCIMRRGVWHDAGRDGEA
ncbi:MAG TPA: hypothetical protein VLW52_02055 [Opitutaceae bacterium]|nr:hypothetical protein [Opitutaceae bacterium]